MMVLVLAGTGRSVSCRASKFQGRTDPERQHTTAVPWQKSPQSSQMMTQGRKKARYPDTKEAAEELLGFTAVRVADAGASKKGRVTGGATLGIVDDVRTCAGVHVTHGTLISRDLRYVQCLLTYVGLGCRCFS